MNRIEGPHLRSTHSLDQLIEQWWADHFPGSAVARDTAAWNIAHAAKETLKLLLIESRKDPAGRAPVTCAEIRGEDLQRSI
ncbi:MAG: hypothetical protein ACREE2_00920 [Stellaceae bacterium]